MNISTKTAIKTQARNYLNNLKDDLTRSGAATVKKIALDHPPENLRQFRNTIADLIEQLDVELPLPTPIPSSSLLPSPSPLVGDLNGDDEINQQDLMLLLSDYVNQNNEADFVTDGKINSWDYNRLTSLVQ